MSGELPSGSSVGLCGLPDDGGSAPQQFASIVSTVRNHETHETRTFLLIDNSGKGVARHRDRTAPDVSHAGISGVPDQKASHRPSVPDKTPSSGILSGGSYGNRCQAPEVTLRMLMEVSRKRVVLRDTSRPAPATGSATALAPPS